MLVLGGSQGRVSVAQGGGGDPPVGEGNLTSFGLYSEASSGECAFTIGHAFPKGDVPNGMYATTDAAQSQVVILNRWPDNSAKFGVVSVIDDCVEDDAITITVSRTNDAPSGTDIDTDALDAVTAEIEFDGVAVEFDDDDWGTPFYTHVEGPVMSSWTYRKPIGMDAHLVAWLEVRAYSNGAVEVLPWIENGYLEVADPIAKIGRARFEFGGSERYDSDDFSDATSGYYMPITADGSLYIPAHTRHLLVGGGPFSHWLGTDPEITPQHDREYLASTEVVPNYSTEDVEEATLDGFANFVYSPGKSTLTEGMGSTGGAGDIGLVPRGAASLLVTGGDPRAYRYAMGEGFSLGSYPIHYRDEDTDRPLIFVDHEDLNTNSGGTLAPTVDPWFTFTGTLSSVDGDTFSWTSGTYTNIEGASYSIASGSADTLVAAPADTFIFIDPAVSTTEFQLTTTRADAFGNGRWLVGYARAHAEAPAGTTLTALAQSLTQYVYAASHHPAAAYVPYVVSAWNWFVEEIQFQNTAHYLATNPSQRQDELFRIAPGYQIQTGWNDNSGHRSLGWQLRTMAMGASITPDADTEMRDQLLEVFAYNITMQRDLHDGGASANSLYLLNNETWWDSLVGETAIYAPWQYDYVALSLGFARSLEVLVDPDEIDDLAWFSDYVLRATVARFGEQNDVDAYNYRYASNYQFEAGVSDGMGGFTLYDTWGELFENSCGENTGLSGDTLKSTGFIACSEFDVVSAPEFSTNAYWGTASSALAYAVQHGVTGAAEGRERLLAASNYDLTDDIWPSDPLWAIAPLWTPPYSLPEHGYAVEIGTNTHRDVMPPSGGWDQATWDRTYGGSQGAGDYVPTYSAGGAYAYAGTGGHNHPDFIGAHLFDFTDATWYRLDVANDTPDAYGDPGGYSEDSSSDGTGEGTCSAPPCKYELNDSDGVPLPPHPYGKQVYLPRGEKGSLIYVGRAAVGEGAEQSPAVHRFDLATRTWSLVGTDHNARTGTEGDSVLDIPRNRIWAFDATLQNHANHQYLDLADDEMKTTTSGASGPAEIVNDKRIMLHDGLFMRPSGGLGLWLSDPEDAGNVWTQVDLDGDLPFHNFNNDPDVDWLSYNRWARFSDGNWYHISKEGGNTLHVVIPPAGDPMSGTWTVETVTILGETLPPAYGGLTLNSVEHYGKLIYVSSIDCLAWLPGGDNPVYLIRPPLGIGASLMNFNPDELVAANDDAYELPRRVANGR